MLAAVDYAALVAAVKTRMGDLFAPDLSRKLLDAPTAPALMDLLGQQNVPVPTDGSLPSKQWLLLHWLVPDYQAVIRRAPRPALRLIRALVNRLEVENVKYVLRALAANTRINPEALLNLGDIASIKRERLVKTERVGDLLSVFSHTVYEAPFRTSGQNLEGEGQTLSIEAALDQCVYAELANAARRFSGPGAVQIRLLVKRLISGLCQLWIARYRLNYGLHPEAAFGLSRIGSLPEGSESLRKLAEVNSFDALFEQIPLLEEAKGKENQQAANKLIPLERDLWRKLYLTASAMLLGPPFRLSIVVGFLFLKEWAIHDLALLCQAKQLGLPSTDITARLIRT